MQQRYLRFRRNLIPLKERESLDERTAVLVSRTAPRNESRTLLDMNQLTAVDEYICHLNLFRTEFFLRADKDDFSFYITAAYFLQTDTNRTIRRWTKVVIRNISEKPVSVRWISKLISNVHICANIPE